jgi:putative two-component system response regulator
LTASRRARILIVDDEEVNRLLLSRILTREGYETVSAADGESAIKTFMENPPDVVLLDVRMPGMDGFAVCEKLKRSPYRLVPVVIITAAGDRANRLRGINTGADDFIAKPFDIEELTARVSSLVRLKRYTDELDSSESIIRGLALTIEARDPSTLGHCERLSRYAVGLGRRIGLDAEELSALDRGGYLHDVGKVGIPDRLLLKPGALDPAEYEMMKQHTILGEKICGTFRSLTPVRQIVRHHHERTDGTGYPDGLRGDDIPLLAQIVSIADCFDALTMDRPYRPAQRVDQALDALAAEAAKGIRRPDLVAAFITLIESKELTRH